MICPAAETDPNFAFSIERSADNQAKAVIKVNVKADHMLYRDQMSISAENAIVEIEWPKPERKKDPFGDSLIEDSPLGDGLIEVYPQGSHLFPIQLVPQSQGLASSILTMNYQGCSSITS
jgi:hypothetical protein